MGMGLITHSLTLLGLVLQDNFSLPCSLQVNVEVNVGHTGTMQYNSISDTHLGVERVKIRSCQVYKKVRNYPYLFIASPRNEPRVFKGDSSKCLEKFETITRLVKCQICWILFSTKLSGYTSHRTVTGES